MPMPTKRTPKLEEQVLARLSGGEPLASIGRDLGFHPTTWNDWCAADETLKIAHGKARDDGYDAIAAETLRIADTPVEGIETTTKADGGIEEKRFDMLGHRKLQIETRLKLLAKWDPRRYGERMTHAGDPDSPLVFTKLTRTVVDPKAGT